MSSCLHFTANARFVLRVLTKAGHHGLEGVRAPKAGRRGEFGGMRDPSGTLRAMQTAILKEKEERRLLRGHLWAYRNEFAQLPEVGDGEIVDIVSLKGRLIARGFYQARGGIAVRILTDREEPIDSAFIARRVARAKRYRDSMYPAQSTYRWIHGESDGLPGLIADRYDGVVCAETTCAFYSQCAEDLANAFLSVDGVRGVRLEVNSTVQTFGDASGPVEVEINALRYLVDIDAGQKTGMFLDQRENCAMATRVAESARVFDGFCYAGQWSLNMAKANAAQVVGVDSSPAAIEAARRNAALNGLDDRCAFECGDTGDRLRRGERYDVIILDPPALAKSRGQTQKALGLYQSLNRDAMNALEHGGYLITSSCSHFVDMPAFQEMLKRAARSAQRDAWIVETRGAARDHPVLMSMPETAYLKCVMLRVF